VLRKHLFQATMLGLAALVPAAAAAQSTSAAPTPAGSPQATVAAAADAAARRALTFDDVTRWRTIQGSTIAADGQWVAWSYAQFRADDVLHVRHVDSGREHVVERASRPAFSRDARWVAYSVAPPFAEVEKLQKDRKPVPRRVELLNLETGEKVGWDDVASFEFARASTHLLVRRNRPEPRPKHDGVDVVLRSLRDGRDELIGSVAHAAFNRAGDLFAYAVDAADEHGNGLYLIELATGLRRVLDGERARYSRLTWSEDGTALAVLRGTDVDTLVERSNTLVAFTGVRAGRQPATRVAIAEGAPGMPAAHVVSEKGVVAWSEANDRVFFGTKEQALKPKPDENAWLRASDVDVFHWNDDRIQTVQRRQAENDRDRTERAALDVASSRVVPLTDDAMRGIQLTRDGRWGIGFDGRAYVSDWQEARSDVYRVDVDSGERRRILEAHGRTLGLSPDGRRFLYWRDGHVWSYELATDRHTNITARAPVSFVNEEWDYLTTKPPYGVTGFTSDGRHVILEHRYDLWLVPLDGSTPRVLTGGVGSEHEIRFRYVQTDPEARTIDVSRPLLLSAYGEWTKRSGFYELRGGRMRELVYEDRGWGRAPGKAADAERLLVTRSHWTEFPDLRVASLDFAEVRQITDANPQTAEYAWGRRILFDYTNRDGVRLQGTLVIPDSWQPGTRLPMIVSFYEKYSQNLHAYPTPSFAHRPDPATYVSSGYLFMQPDIHFRGGSSHSDMLECVEAAVQKVIEMGYADPARVGLHGHSYSGGGASYIATRSNMFAAIVAGAAPINLVSEFNQLFRGSGQNNHYYDIHGQGRYGSNPYDDFDRYWQQSPISGVTTMETPLLYMHGDDDQIVEYLQGMELYNALRFNRKPVIFLSYPGEGHGLTKIENQLDFQARMRDFYEHYLKGAPAASWITDGERFIDKERREPVRLRVREAAETAETAGAARP
jgi:dipeptidyl aminopeptidase/acylaminoacyl peptidase